MDLRKALAEQATSRLLKKTLETQEKLGKRHDSLCEGVAAEVLHNGVYHEGTITRLTESEERIVSVMLQSGQVIEVPVDGVSVRLALGVAALRHCIRLGEEEGASEAALQSARAILAVHAIEALENALAPFTRVATPGNRFDRGYPIELRLEQFDSIRTIRGVVESTDDLNTSGRIRVQWDKAQDLEVSHWCKRQQSAQRQQTVDAQRLQLSLDALDAAIRYAEEVHVGEHLVDSARRQLSRLATVDLEAKIAALNGQSDELICPGVHVCEL
jgi:hypothetical protein